MHAAKDVSMLESCHMMAVVAKISLTYLWRWVPAHEASTETPPSNTKTNNTSISARPRQENVTMLVKSITCAEDSGYTVLTATAWNALALDLNEEACGLLISALHSRRAGFRSHGCKKYAQ